MIKSSNYDDICELNTQYHTLPIRGQVASAVRSDMTLVAVTGLQAGISYLADHGSLVTNPLQTQNVLRSYLTFQTRKASLVYLTLSFSAMVVMRKSMPPMCNINHCNG